MLPIKVMGKAGSGISNSATLEASAFLARTKQAGVNIRVINASYGGPAFSQAASDAIAYLDSLDILFVASAGNEATSEPNYPGSYKLPNIINVAAYSSIGRIASFSSFGPTVHLFAPGVNIITTVGDTAGARVDGTSFAAPQVAGAAALLMDHEPGLPAREVRKRILDSVTRTEFLIPFVKTGGRLNMAKLMGLTVPPDPSPYNIPSLCGS
jgi:thermitase